MVVEKKSLRWLMSRSFNLLLALLIPYPNPFLPIVRNNMCRNVNGACDDDFDEEVRDRESTCSAINNHKMNFTEFYNIIKAKPRVEITICIMGIPPSATTTPKRAFGNALLCSIANKPASRGYQIPVVHNNRNLYCFGLALITFLLLESLSRFLRFGCPWCFLLVFAERIDSPSFTTRRRQHTTTFHSFSLLSIPAKDWLVSSPVDHFN